MILSSIWVGAFVELGWEVSIYTLSVFMRVRSFKWEETWRDCVRAHWTRNPSVKVLKAKLKPQVYWNPHLVRSLRRVDVGKGCQSTIKSKFSLSLTSSFYICVSFTWIYCVWKRIFKIQFTLLLGCFPN